MQLGVFIVPLKQTSVLFTVWRPLDNHAFLASSEKSESPEVRINDLAAPPEPLHPLMSLAFTEQGFAFRDVLAAGGGFYTAARELLVSGCLAASCAAKRMSALQVRGAAGGSSYRRQWGYDARRQNIESEPL